MQDHTVNSKTKAGVFGDIFQIEPEPHRTQSRRLYKAGFLIPQDTEIPFPTIALGMVPGEVGDWNHL